MARHESSHVERMRHRYLEYEMSLYLISLYISLDIMTRQLLSFYDALCMDCLILQYKACDEYQVVGIEHARQ